MSTNTRQRAEMMAEAGRLLAAVARDLDDSAVTCRSCGMSKKVNWDETQIKEALEGMVLKLARLAEKVAG